MSTQEPKTSPTSKSTARGAKRPAPRGTAFYPRKRANAACQVCRARKTKCDNLKPKCSYCLSVGAVCNQTAEDLSSFDPASLKILSRLDDLEQLVRSQKPEENQSRPQSREPTLSGRIDGPTTLRPSQTQRPSGEDHCNVTPPTNTDAHLLSVSSGPPERLLQLPVFGDKNIPVTSLIQDPPRGKEAGNPPQSASSGPGDAALFSRVLSTGGVHVLLDRFFEYVNCKNPILEEAATRQLVLSMALEGPSWSSRSCLALIVCALGCIATPFSDQADTDSVVEPTPAALAEAKVLFEAAQRRMGVLLVQGQEEEEEGNNLIAPQCLLLAGLYMMCVLRPFQAWRFFSQALGACQQLGFLQQMYNEELGSNPIDRSSVRYSSQEQAVYWSAWKSERELRQCLFLPDFSAARDASHLYPPLFPTPPSTGSDDEVDERRQRASWLFYLAEISLRRLMSRVCREISTLYSSVATTSVSPGTDNQMTTADLNATYLARLAAFVPEYEEQGRQWAASLPAELSLESPIEYDDVCRFVLRGHYVDYWEALYWPFLAGQLGCYTSSLAEMSQPPPPTSALSPVQNTGGIKTGNVPLPTQYTSSHYAGQSPPARNSNLAELCLEIHTWRIRINEPGYRHRHHGTLFLIRGCVRSAIVLLSAALQGMNMPVDWSGAVSSVVGLLAHWETEIPWLSEWRNFLVSTLSDVLGA